MNALLLSESHGFGGLRNAVSSSVCCISMSLVGFSGPSGTMAMPGVILASNSAFVMSGATGNDGPSGTSPELLKDSAGLDEAKDMADSSLPKSSEAFLECPTLNVAIFSSLFATISGNEAKSECLEGSSVRVAC